MAVKDISARWMKASKALQERGPDLLAYDCRDSQKALKRGILCSGRSAGGGGIFGAGGDDEGKGLGHSKTKLDRWRLLNLLGFS